MSYDRKNATPCDRIIGMLDFDKWASGIENADRDIVIDDLRKGAIDFDGLIDWCNDKIKDPSFMLEGMLDRESDDIEHLSPLQIEFMPRARVLARLRDLSIEWTSLAQAIQSPSNSELKSKNSKPKRKTAPRRRGRASASSGGLTLRHRQLLGFIQKYIELRDVAPTFREMRNELKIKSKSTIHRLLTDLEERGYIIRIAYRARGIGVLRLLAGEQQVVVGGGVSDITGSAHVVIEGLGVGRSGSASAADGHVLLPMFGRIAYRTPIKAFKDHDTQVQVPEHMVRAGGDCYALEVVGSSMIDAGLREGDIVVIQRTAEVVNGEITIVLIDEQTVAMERIYDKGKSIVLEPANKEYATSIYSRDRIDVLGRLLGSFRQS